MITSAAEFEMQSFNQLAKHFSAWIRCCCQMSAPGKHLWVWAMHLLLLSQHCWFLVFSGREWSLKRNHFSPPSWRPPSISGASPKWVYHRSLFECIKPSCFHQCYWHKGICLSRLYISFMSWKSTWSMHVWNMRLGLKLPNRQTF